MKQITKWVAVGALALVCGGSAWAQAAPAAAKPESPTEAKPAPGAPNPAARPGGHEDTRPMRTFYLRNATQQSDANEILIAFRNMLDGSDRIYLLPSQNAIVLRASADDFALAEKLLRDLDRPKKAYRLTYTLTDMDGGKRVGTQHCSMVLVTGARTVLKQGSKVPVVTGSYAASSGSQTQFQYLDVGLNIDASLDEAPNGTSLRSKVEQSSVADEKLTGEVREPVIRQAVLEGTALLTLGKPIILGSLDVPGSTRHLDIEVELEDVK